MTLIISNIYLERSQMTDNAQYIADYLIGNGWTQNAVAGILGNMEQESTMNPGLWQDLKYENMSGGYGLVQWTPATEYTSWADRNGYPWGGDTSSPTVYVNGQLERILWEVRYDQQWIATSAFPFSFTAFTQSGEAPEYLAEAFMKNYERPGIPELEKRKQNARYWFENLQYGGSRLEDVVQLVLSRVGKNTYSQDGGLRQRVFDEPNGYSDCSSLMWKAFERGAGIQIGTWTRWVMGSWYGITRPMKMCSLWRCRKSPVQNAGTWCSGGRTMTREVRPMWRCTWGMISSWATAPGSAPG